MPADIGEILAIVAGGGPCEALAGQMLRFDPFFFPPFFSGLSRKD